MIELTDDEADFLTDKCMHKPRVGGWCLDCDAKFKALIEKRLQNTVTSQIKRVCPTPCDDDCASLCHEVHNPTHKQEHDVAWCVGVTLGPTRGAAYDSVAVLIAGDLRSIADALASPRPPLHRIETLLRTRANLLDGGPSGG